MAKPIAVFDIDGTIFRSSLIIEITNALINASLFPDTVGQHFEQSYTRWLNRDGSYDDYINDVVGAFKRHLNGVRVKDLEKIADLVIADLSRRTYRFTRDLIKQLQNSHFLIAISNSPEALVSRFAKVYGFRAYSATEYESKNGSYTGRDVYDIKGRIQKDQVLSTLLHRRRLSLDNSIGVGDSEGDIPMLSLVQNPIAFNPNSRLFAEANRQGWKIVVERKDVIYYYNHGHKIP